MPLPPKFTKRLLLGAMLALAVGFSVFNWREPSQREDRGGEGRAGGPAPVEGEASPLAAAPDGAAAPADATHLVPSGRGGEDLPTVADVLEEIGDLSVPGARERAMERLRVVEGRRRALAEEEALRRGLPLRIERPDGTVQELSGFENGQPVYFTTHNANAAISTGANLLRLTPYSLNASGLMIGMWDGGSGRASHQEFSTGSRLKVMDGAAVIDHATHVAGTLAAAGVSTSARGMAVAALVDSYDWNDDKSEMTARAAAAPNESGKLHLSNHSYGFVSGWNWVAGAGSPARTWEWWGDGTGTSGYEHDFGRYNSFARDSDAIAHSAPYFLMFRSAGNERIGNPVNGDAVALSPGSSTVVSYSTSLHPPGDGAYRGGFETMGFDSIAKNVVAVGSVTDAVTSGVRDPAAAKLNNFTSWGPTDDGRVKPDLVANGDAVRSSLAGSNTAYGYFSGTSMAAPNATGTAALLIQEYGLRFSGGAMRSSTLKGVLVHTADDLGHPGPDYQFGWGLINGVAAVDLIKDHAENPLKIRMTEELITSSNATLIHEFVWDGVSPIRVTLCWTDPAGSATNTNDLRTPRLVNDLNLRVVGPEGAENYPWTMPFVGTWTQASMELPADKGINRTDNVERVDISVPGEPGVYRCFVTYSGTLANDQQRYSLLVSGSANETPPPPPLALESVSPSSALPGPATLELTGTGFEAGTTLALVRSGQPDLAATGVEFLGSTALRAQFDLSGATAGLWGLRAANPGGETATLPDSFAVLGAIWSESFDGTVTGWTTQATTGSNAWVYTTEQSHSPPRSVFASGPASKSTTHLQSPSIGIPTNASEMQFKFWHRFDLQADQDGGRLEFSLDGGAWFGIDSANSGAVFASNGYNSTISNSGKPVLRSDFAGKSAWSGNSGGFVETVVNLTDNAKYAGKSLRVRWTLATNGSIASQGWWVDSVSLVGGGDLANEAPVITEPASSDSTESVVDPDDGTVFDIARGASVGLSVSASDDGGEAALVYTWTGVRAGGGDPPSFEANGSNAAKNTAAWFESAGDYLLTVIVSDEQGLAASSSLNVRVLQTADSISVSPAVASLTVGGTQAFVGAVLDQFGDPLEGGGTAFAWSASGGGTIDGSGLFSATSAGGPFVVTAESGDLEGIAAVTVNPAPRTYAPAPPQLFDPEGGTSLIQSPGGVKLSWAPDERANWHEIYITRNGALYLRQWLTGEPEIDGDGNAVFNFNTAELPPGDYQWWVRSWAPVTGSGGWSAPGSFTVACEPLDPPAMPGGQTEFEDHWPLALEIEGFETSATWAQFEVLQGGASFKQLWVSITERGQGASYDAQTGAGDSAFTILPDGAYQWRARIWSSCHGNSEWSALRELSIAGTACTGPLAALEPGQIDIDLDHGFSGAAGAGSNPVVAVSPGMVPPATWYQLWIGSAGGGGAVLSKWYRYADIYDPSGGAGGSYRLEAGQYLAAGNYLAYVRGYNACGYGAWSAAKPFAVEAPASLEVTGLDVAFDGDGALRALWNGLPGVDWYQVWINSDGTNVFNRWFDGGGSGGGGYLGTVEGSGLAEFRGPAGSAVHAPGSYAFWVRTYLAGGAYGPWVSATGTSPVDLAAVPVLEPTVEVEDGRPEIRWNEATAAGSYEIYLSRNGALYHRESLLPEDLVWDEGSRTWTGSPPQEYRPYWEPEPGSYRAWVRVQGGTRFGPWSAAVDFVLP